MIDTETAAAIQYELGLVREAIAKPDADLIAVQFKLQEISAAIATLQRGGRVLIEQRERDDE